jgi:hypothetical protein
MHVLRRKRLIRPATTAASVRQRRLLQLLAQRTKRGAALARQLAAVAAAERAVAARVVRDEEGVRALDGDRACAACVQLLHPVDAHKLHFVAILQRMPAVLAQQHRRGAGLRTRATQLRQGG